MINIRPVSDLRNNYAEIEKSVALNNKPVYLTKNGHGVMVLLSLTQYEALIGDIETKLDEADAEAMASNARLTHKEVFAHAREAFNAK